MSILSDLRDRASRGIGNVTGTLVNGAVNVASSIAPETTQQVVQQAQALGTEVNRYVEAAQEVIPQEVAALQANPTQYAQQHIQQLATHHAELRTELLHDNGVVGSTARLALTVGQDLDRSTGIYTAAANAINQGLEAVGSDVRVGGDNSTHWSANVTNAEARARESGTQEAWQEAGNAVRTQGRSDREAAVMVENAARQATVTAANMVGKAVTGNDGFGVLAEAGIEGTFQTLERAGVMSQQINVDTAMPGHSVGSGVASRVVNAAIDAGTGNTERAAQTLSDTSLRDVVTTAVNAVPVPVDRIPGGSRVIAAVPTFARGAVETGLRAGTSRALTAGANAAGYERVGDVVTALPPPTIPTVPGANATQIAQSNPPAPQQPAAQPPAQPATQVAQTNAPPAPQQPAAQPPAQPTTQVAQTNAPAGLSNAMQAALNAAKGINLAQTGMKLQESTPTGTQLASAANGYVPTQVAAEVPVTADKGRMT